MSKYTIAIPNSLYEKAQRLAKQTSQSMDDLICMRLEGALDQPLLDLPRDERCEMSVKYFFVFDASCNCIHPEGILVRDFQRGALACNHN